MDVKSSAENVKNYLRANKTMVTYVFAFAAANVVCFSIRAYEYRNVPILAGLLLTLFNIWSFLQGLVPK